MHKPVYNCVFSKCIFFKLFIQNDATFKIVLFITKRYGE